MYVSDILKRENNNLDFIRLFTALIVVWYHAQKHFPDSYASLPTLHPKTIELGALAVCVFFFISGLLVTNSLLSKREVIPFVISRFGRIYPAYFVMLILCVFIMGPCLTSLSIKDYFTSSQTWTFFVKNSMLNFQANLPGVWEGLTSNIINGSIWTIPFEVTCYIIVLVGFVLYRKWKMSPWVIILPAMAFAFLPIEISQGILRYGHIFFGRPHFFCFIIGTIFAIYREKIKVDKTLVLALILLTVVFYHWVSVIEFLFPITVAITLLYCSTIKPIIGWRLPHDLSYGIYIFHDPILQIVCNQGVAHSWLIAFLITAALVIPIAYLSARFIEEPSIRFSKRLSKRKFNLTDNGVLIIVILVVGVIVAKLFY